MIKSADPPLGLIPGRKPHTDPRKHKFASETICTQCKHFGEALRMWFVFILPDSIWDKGLVLVIALLPLLTTGHISRHSRLCYRMAEFTQLFRVLSRPQGKHMGIPEDRVHKAISLIRNCSLQPPSPSSDTHWASATMWQGWDKAEQSEVNNNSLQLMLSERLTTSGREGNKYTYKGYVNEVLSEEKTFKVQGKGLMERNARAGLETSE